MKKQNGKPIRKRKCKSKMKTQNEKDTQNGKQNIEKQTGKAK